tara:strand:+ start:2033 stop:2323 length:291 start_codon:yes stop_codon:yes gene_type:complete
VTFIIRQTPWIKFTEDQKQLIVSVHAALEEIPLTLIESHVCSLLFLGKTAKEIAAKRHCSYRTVERHVDNIKAKVGDHKLSPIILYAIVVFSLESG